MLRLRWSFFWRWFVWRVESGGWSLPRVKRDLRFKGSERDVGRRLQREEPIVEEERVVIECFGGCGIG